ncbi:MAG: hypothetical protein J7497_09375, partial [Chitinophagaceae bacterium]|nr:hypothetical protein [Chitinophagaceae bacterium]
MKSINLIIKEIKHPVANALSWYDLVRQISIQFKFPSNAVKKGITQGMLKINGKITNDTDIQLTSKMIIHFQGQTVLLPKPPKKHFVDEVIEAIRKELNVRDVHQIPAGSLNAFCCYLIEFFADNNYESLNLQECAYFTLIIDKLESHYRHLNKEGKDAKIPKRKELIEALVKAQVDKINELDALVAGLSSGTYDRDLFRFLSDYIRILNTPQFQLCVAPLLSPGIISKASIQN